MAERHGISARHGSEVIHNGMHDIAPELRACPGIAPPHIAMVARFEPPKDHQLLLTALSRLQDCEWTLEFVGGGAGLNRARQAAAQLGLEKRVLFSGSSPNVAERLSRAQLFVLTSHSEGFPRSILEAMRAGLPVVASDVGGIAEAVTPQTGILAPRGDATALTEALRRLIDQPELRVKLGVAGRARYERLFRFSTTFSKTAALYERVVPGGKNTTARGILIVGQHGNSQ